MSVRVALVGCGMWGHNLLRALVQNPRAEVVAVADTSPAKLARARLLTPGAQAVTSLEEALAARPDAVVIATPSASHAAIALDALDAGVDVFVEKPLAVSPADAERCVAKAAALGRIGMVGHLLRYHPAVVRLVELARDRRLGEVRHVTAARLLSRGDRSSSVLWSLGPHDLSVLLALDPGPIASIEAEWFDDGERVVLDVRMGGGVTARIDLARLNPTKERRISVVGSQLTAFFDDVRAPDRISLAESAPGREPPRIYEEERVAWREPLSVEIDHFLDCVERRARPLTPFEEGAAVVRALARVEGAAPRRSQAAAIDLGADMSLREPWPVGR